MDHKFDFMYFKKVFILITFIEIALNEFNFIY